MCSARKGQKRVDSIGVRVGDLRSSVTKMDIDKAKQDEEQQEEVDKYQHLATDLRRLRKIKKHIAKNFTEKKGNY